jgi:murein DD-endopeptidase MepM/ murein hydrolase activator NlpD
MPVLGRILTLAIACALLGAPAARGYVDASLERSFSGDGPVFPLLGAYDFGTAANGFGGGRGHDGHDVFADCGEPVVAAFSGTVLRATYEGAAGHYIVVTSDDGRSQVYMHLQHPARFTEGEEVRAGQRIGRVGTTGRADGCHLHFELWTAPGWYAGGRAVDPIGSLRRWAAAD